MGRKATGSSYVRGGKVWAVVTHPQTKKRVHIDCPPKIKTKADGKRYAEWASEQARAGKLDLDALVNRRPRTAAQAPGAAGETFEAWTERWLEARIAKGLRSVGGDESMLRCHLLPHLGAKAVAAITRDEVEGVRDVLDGKIRAGELAWKTAWNIWCVLTTALHDATASKDRSLRMRADNPALGLEGPDRGIRKAKQYLYPSEFLAFVTCESVPLRWRRLVTLASYTGLRAGELRALLWSDIDTEHRVLHVTKATNRKTGKVGTTKSGDTRRVPLEAELVQLLEVMRVGAEPTDHVTWLPPFDDQSTTLRYYLDRAGVTRAELHREDSRTSLPIRFHDTRATALTWWAVRGDEPLKIKQRAGHRDLATTEQYIREAEVHGGEGFGQVFPPLPAGLLRPAAPERRVVPVEAGATRAAVIAYLTEQGRPVAPRELATVVGRSYWRTRVAIRALEGQGLVVVEGATNNALVRLTTPEESSRQSSIKKSTPSKRAKSKRVSRKRTGIEPKGGA